MTTASVFHDLRLEIERLRARARSLRQSVNRMQTSTRALRLTYAKSLSLKVN